MRRFLDEFMFWIALGVGISLFAGGFLPLFKIASSKLPLPGLHEALASSS